MILSIHPLAEGELSEGAAYYMREGSRELGESFVSEFERAVGMLREYPKLGAHWGGKLRRLPVRRFPYSIVYALSGDTLRVLALAHQRREPGYWRGRK